MYRPLITVLALLLITPPAISQDIASAIDSLWRHHQETRQFSGVVLVAKERQIIFHESTNTTEFTEKTGPDEDTRFPIASITKTFTAVLIMQLVEQGHLQLEAPITTYLHLDNLPNAKDITVHHLLTHTSGLAREPDEAYQQALSPMEMIARYATQKPFAKAGEAFSYNNLDYILLGLLIEAQYGQSWSEVLTDKILRPLQMNHTGFLQNDARQPELIAGFLTKGPSETIRVSDYAVGNYHAAAAMYSTAGDLFKFDQALYDGNLLSDTSLESMYTSFPEFGYVAYGWWVYRYPFLGSQPKIVERRGGLPGFNHAFLRMPEEGHTVIILSNNDRFDPDAFGDPKNLKDQLIRILYP